jgi:hypothetical protein
MGLVVEAPAHEISDPHTKNAVEYSATCDVDVPSGSSLYMTTLEGTPKPTDSCATKTRPWSGQRSAAQSPSAPPSCAPAAVPARNRDAMSEAWKSLKPRSCSQRVLNTSPAAAAAAAGHS